MKYFTRLFKVKQSFIKLTIIAVILGNFTSLQAQVLKFYGAADSGDRLYLYDTGNNSTVEIGSFGTSSVESLKYNQDNTSLYAFDHDQLGTINLETGEFLDLPNTVGSGLQGEAGTVNVGDIDAFAFDPSSGIIYAAVVNYSFWGDGRYYLIQVDPTSGQYIPGVFNGDDYVVIETPGYQDDVDGMAFDPTDGTLYAIANNGGSDDKLIIIDKTNGDATEVGYFNDGNSNVNDMEALSATPDGRLFVTNGSNENIYEVDKATGHITLIGTYGNGADFEGSVAFYVYPPKDDDNDGVENELDLDNDNDGISDVNEGCQSDDLDVTDANNLTFTTNIGVDASISMPNGNYEKLSDAVGANNAGLYFDNPNFIFMQALPRLNDGLQIEFSPSTLTNLPDSGDGAAFDITFTGKPVHEIYLHYNSVDQFRFVFNHANNPGIAYEILSSVATSNLAVSPDMNAGDNNISDEDQSISDERADGYGSGSADGTIRFYATNGQPIQVLHLGMLEQPGRNTGDNDLWQLAIQVRTARDFDSDGYPDCLDLDADNDGIYDIVETGHAANDTNHDGRTDNQVGNNGLDNNLENDDSNTAVNNFIPLNTDGTGNPDYIDIDADDDGIVDNIEGQTTAGYTAPSGNDSNHNGVDDAYDTNGAWIDPTDTDSDGLPDYRDSNSDGDTDNDALEGWDTDNDGVADTILSGNDADNDGLDDAYDNDDTQINPTNGQVPTDFPDLDNPGGDRDWRQAIDTDNDGIPDIVDIDDDNDGIPDVDEALNCTLIQSPVFTSSNGPYSENGSDVNNPQIGDSFRFVNVYPGVDAILTYENGVGITSIDHIDMVAGTLNDNLQPVITYSSANAYLDLKILFVKTGTTIPVDSTTFFVTVYDNDYSEIVAYNDNLVTQSFVDTPRYSYSSVNI